MDSTVGLPTLDPAAPNAGARWGMLARAWVALTLAPPPGRPRRLELDRLRLGLVALAVAGAAALADRAWRWSRADAASADIAARAAAFADERMSRIGEETAALDMALGPTRLDEGCGAQATLALVRASLASQLVQRFVLVDADALTACGPEGPTAVPRESLSASQLLALAGSAAGTEAAALRRRAGGDILIAQLDPRAFDGRTAAGPWHGGAAVSIRDSEDRHLVAISALPPQAAMPGPGAATTVQSPQHQLHVRAALPAPAANGTAALVVLLALAAYALAVSLWWQRRLARVRQTARLAAALRKRQFVPFIQPIVDTATGRCVGGEVLMRWQHPYRGVLAPGEFIEAAERSGLIEPMSELVMATAALQLAPLAQVDPQLSFSFNVTAGLLRRPGFVSQLAQWFNDDTLPARQVVLELTERDAVDPLAALALRAAHRAGWRLAIDDFGTGHSSLAVLESLPIDRIKIDRAFVRTIDERTLSRPVLDTIIQLAAQLRLPLVAEGVETETQRAYLAERGVQWTQGFLMARPMTLPAFARWLGQRQGGPALPPQALSPADLDWLRRLAGPGGVAVRDRYWRLSRFERCFVGREAVDWLVREAGMSRAQAVQLGRRWLAAGSIAHVCDEHDFDDAVLFYRIVPPAQAALAADASVDRLLEAIGAGEGPAAGAHCRGLLVHRQAVTGRDVVGWIAARSGLARPAALELGQALMRRGRLRHVYDDLPLHDSRALYRMV